MTVDEALETLGAPGLDVPVAAMQALLDDWGEAAPRCRALLRGFVTGQDVSEATGAALFHVICLLGEKAEAAAFADLCALAGDPERADLVLGDMLPEMLPGILINAYGGDPGPLRALVESPEAGEVARGTALLAMAYLAHARRLPKAEMHAYLAGLPDRLGPGCASLWLDWATAVALLGFGALAGKVNEAFERGLLDPRDLAPQDFRADLRLAMEAPASLEGFDRIGIGPMGGAIATLASVGAPPEPAPPHVNLLRGVGRNDPCPCGSGRKFKKCCLGAEAG